MKLRRPGEPQPKEAYRERVFAPGVGWRTAIIRVGSYKPHSSYRTAWVCGRRGHVIYGGAAGATFIEDTDQADR